MTGDNWDTGGDQAGEQGAGNHGGATQSWVDGGRYDVCVVENALGEEATAYSCAVRFFCAANNSYITGYFSMSDAAFEWTEKKLQAIGWNARESGAFDKLGTDSKYLYDLAEKLHPGGPHCRIQVKYEEYPLGSGKWTPKVGFVDPPGGGPMFSDKKAASAESAKGFEAMMRTKLRTGQVQTTARAQPRAVAPARAAPNPAAPARPSQAPVRTVAAAAPQTGQPGGNASSGTQQPAQQSQIFDPETRRAEAPARPTAQQEGAAVAGGGFRDPVPGQGAGGSSAPRPAAVPGGSSRDRPAAIEGAPPAKVKTCVFEYQDGPCGELVSEKDAKQVFCEEHAIPF